MKRLLFLAILLLPVMLLAQASYNIITVPFSLFPNFVTGNGSTLFNFTLTGNVISSSLNGGSLGMEIIFNVCQDNVGNHSFPWPPNVNNPPPVLQSANACTIAKFINNGGFNWVPSGTNSLNSAAATTGTFTNLTVSGTQTNTGATTINQPNGYIVLVNNDATYPCTGPGLSAAITAAALVGHVVDATNCTGTISPASGLTISANNVQILFGSQTWSFPIGVTAPFTINGTGVVFQCRQQQTIFTMAYLGTTSPSVPANMIAAQGLNDEVNDCLFQGQATASANNFQVAINLSANNQKARRNVITGIDGTHGFNWGIAIQGTISGHYVENNIINQIMTKSDATGFGIITGQNVTQGFIRANQITFSTGGQIHIYLSQGVQQFEVSDNVLTNSGPGTTNMIKLSSIVSGAANAASFVNIHDNIMQGCTSCGPQGIVLLGPNTPHNRIANNSIIAGVGTTGPGITLDGTSSTVGTPDFNDIVNNKIENSGTQGIFIASGNKNFVYGNTIRNPSTLAASTYDAIKIQGDAASNGAASNMIIGNIVQDGTYRMPLNIANITPLPSGTIVSGNSFHNSGQGTIQDQGTGTIFGPNVINDNTSAHPSGVWVGGANASATSTPTQVITSSGQFFGAVGNTVALTADWTCGTGGTVASCTSATIIGSGGGVPLTFTLPLVAQSYILSCDGVVGQATAATLNQWNLLTATNGATNVTANYTMGAAVSSVLFGAVTDQAATTTTFQITPSWTLGGTGTKMPFHIWAKIEGASASGTVVSLQLLAPTVGDLVTIYRGTSCTVF